MTFRAVRVLKEVDTIACEDTRTTLKLLNHFGVAKPLVSYHEHNESARTTELTEAMKAGQSVALVSDAGTPLISDPGYRLVGAAIQAGIQVVPIPGASALLTALIGSGLMTDQFRFVGFLPAREQARQRFLKQIASDPSPTIFYESPHRIIETLSDMTAAFGDRLIVLARELTKLHEEFLRGTAESIRDTLSQRPAIRGEFTIVVGKAEDAPAGESDPVLEVQRLESDLGLPRMEAIKTVAKSRGISKGELYKVVVQRLGSTSR